MKRIIGYIFIGSGFLLTGSFGVGMVGCISVVREVFLGIKDVAFALKFLLIMFSLLLIGSSLFMCGFRYFFNKTFRVSFSLSMVCLTLGAIIGLVIFIYIARKTM